MLLLSETEQKNKTNSPNCCALSQMTCCGFQAEFQRFSNSPRGRRWERGKGNARDEKDPKLVMVVCTTEFARLSAPIIYLLLIHPWSALSTVAAAGCDKPLAPDCCYLHQQFFLES